MPRLTFRFASALCLFALLSLPACRPAGSADDGDGAPNVHTVPEGTEPKLAFVTNNASEFWKIADKGLEKAREEGIAIDLKQPTTGKVEEQKGIIEDLVSQGYHGIAVSVISARDMARDLNKAAEHLNVITHDSDAPESDRLAYIGTNNFEAGKRLGAEIVELLPDGGEMAVFVGTLAADNAKMRLDGIKEAIAGHGIEIVAEKQDNKDLSKARSNVEDVINAYPGIDLLAGLWSYNGPAILAAVKASGKEGDLEIVAFDEEQGTLEGIQQGLIECTCVQKPFEFGYRSAKLLDALCTEGREALPEDPIIDTGVEIIDSSNVDEFEKELAELKK